MGNPQPLVRSAPSWTVESGDAWDLAPTLKAESINTVITSPPYWGLRSYGMTHDAGVLPAWLATGGDSGSSPAYDWYRNAGGVLGLEPYPHWFVSHLVEIFERLKPALASDGSLWVNLGDTYFGRWSSIRDDGRQGLGSAERLRRITPSGGILHDKQMLLIPARFAIAMQDRGWILRNDVIWHKPHMPPRPERDRLRLSHEHLFHFVKRQRKGRPTYYYDLDQVESGALDVISLNSSAALGSGNHSATFPLDLIRPRIRSTTPEDGMVLDPFSGTGTTLVAAVQEGRNAIGFELSDEYAKLARLRLEGLSVSSDT